MPIDKEYQKFRDSSRGKVAIATLEEGGLNIGDYDYIAVTYPTATSEVYTFKSGGASGTTVSTVTLEYTDSTKEDLSSATRV